MAGQSIGLTALLVRDYDEALIFYVGVLGFEVAEDTYIPAQDKRWVVIAPAGSKGSALLLARAVNPEQASRIGIDILPRLKAEDSYYAMHERPHA
jgi:catechol 2,3-dioxygenase-like lactoylglutathione lyase family enzyme